MSNCKVIHCAKLDLNLVSILKKEEAVDKVATPEFYDSHW